MVASALEGHGIPPLLLDDNICRILPNCAYLVGGAKVVVEERYQQDAQDVIGLVYPGNPPFAGSFVVVASGAVLFSMLLLLPWLLWKRRHAGAFPEQVEPL